MNPEFLNHLFEVAHVVKRERNVLKEALSNGMLFLISNGTLKKLQAALDSQQFNETIKDDANSIALLTSMQAMVSNEIQKIQNVTETAPNEWQTTNALALELKVDFRTIQGIARSHLVTHPEWQGHFRDTNGHSSPHYAPELCGKIREEITSKKPTSKGWVTNRILAKRLEIGEKRLRDIAQKYLKDHPEWEEERRDEHGRMYAHYSPQLIKKIEKELSVSCKEAKPNWMTEKTIAEKFGISQDKAANMIAKELKKHPKWCEMAKTANRQDRIHYSPKLIAEIEKTLAAETPATEGWMTAKAIMGKLRATGHTITFETVENIAAPHLKLHPEWRRVSKISTGAMRPTYSPELITLIETDYTNRVPPPEGWKTIGDIAEMLDVSRKRVSKLIDRLATAEHVKDFKDKSYKLSSHYSPELIASVKKIIDMEKEESDDDLDVITQLNLTHAFGMLGHDPYKLKLYIQFAHPGLDDEQVNKLIRKGFKCGGQPQRKEQQYLQYPSTLDDVVLDAEIPSETKENTFILKGKAVGASQIYIAGSWTRTVKVGADGGFEVNIPVKTGQINEFRIMGIKEEKESMSKGTSVTPYNDKAIIDVNEKKKMRSKQMTISILQTEKPDDIRELIKLLTELGDNLRDQIQKDQHRFEFLKQCVEQVLIKRFSRSFEEGRLYTENLISTADNEVIQSVLRKVLMFFEKINDMDFPNLNPEVSLYFFQKYCAHKIEAAKRAKKPGIILANEPGLGKTGTTLVAVNGDQTTIVSPNAVVSTWEDEAEKFLKHPDILALQNIPATTRKTHLAESEASHFITNIEFVRDSDDKKTDEERFKLLAHQGQEFTLVHDEAHSRRNLKSQQSRGIIKLGEKAAFQILLSASPVKDPLGMRRLLHTLYPKDKRFSNDVAFQKAFPQKNPQALKTLNLLLQEHVIRFRKQDVMEEMDPNISPKEQGHCLPRKNHINPDVMGEFELTEEQSYAMYEMFTNWGEWTQKYKRYIPKNRITKMDGLFSGDQLSKRHALRQIANNPTFIGSNAESPKYQMVKQIVEKCLAAGRKPIIFCRYNTQAEEYAKMFADLKPAAYTGITSKMGFKKKKNGEKLRYRHHIDENGKVGHVILDEKGYPIEDPKGYPMLAMDYERITFQKTTDRQLMISTYSAGAVGVTFTAGKAEIFDDLPEDYIEQYQAEDRAHRIDKEFLTHHDIEYYSLIGVYPQSFLEKMKNIFIRKQCDGTYVEVERNSKDDKNQPAKSAYDTFFAQGSFDQVRKSNLKVQGQVFHLINDGIADESILQEGQTKFMGID